MRERAVVDIVGKILTPALLIGLLILIVVGVVSPIGPVGDQALVENVAATGIEAGYQTMDVLATLLFGFIILKSAQAKGYTKAKAQIRVVSGASLVAGIGLLVVYLGLTYLGATTANLFDITVDRTYLVTSIVQQLLGHGGLILFALSLIHIFIVFPRPIVKGGKQENSTNSPRKASVFSPESAKARPGTTLHLLYDHV